MSSREVTFKDFASLAKRRGWTPQFLAERFKGKLESPGEFFHRVVETRSASLVISYRSVLDLYHAETSPLIAGQSIRLCICGCGRTLPSFTKKLLWAPACRKRVSRRVSDTLKWV
jgi:hypothetical protein